jgi:hypothetical protein
MSQTPILCSRTYVDVVCIHELKVLVIISLYGKQAILLSFLDFHLMTVIDFSIGTTI